MFGEQNILNAIPITKIETVLFFHAPQRLLGVDEEAPTLGIKVRIHLLNQPEPKDFTFGWYKELTFYDANKLKDMWNKQNPNDILEFLNK